MSGSAGARGAWSASGITFFMVGVVFTLTMPDNIALGITFLALGVVFFSLSAGPRAPGDGAPGDGAAGDGAAGDGSAGDGASGDAGAEGEAGPPTEPDSGLPPR